MHKRILSIFIAAVVAASQAQPLDLRGRVLEANGRPVADARVELKSRKSATTTTADGFFSLNGNVSIGSGEGRRFDYRLEPDFLSLKARAPLELRMEVFDGAGQRQGGFVSKVGIGLYRLSLAGAMPAAGGKAGLLFLRLRLGGQTFTHPFFHPGDASSGTVFGPAQGAAAAEKRSAAVDSLRISKAGYQEVIRGIASYTAGNLSDLVLTRSRDSGSVCPRQRAVRTSDGFDVVFCEEVYDQPPRVHLPPPTATSAYAAMTEKAFVTLEGASYSFDPTQMEFAEAKRAGSALYEIKIRNGKLESFRPAVLFGESLFMRPLMGKVFEGLISKRTGTGYDLSPSLPVRVQISTEPFAEGDSLYVAKATLVNLAAAVTAANGSCMHSLSSYGAQAPFGSRTDVFLVVGRVPSMHWLGDNELVFTLHEGADSGASIMSQAWFFTPLDLVKNPLVPTGTYSGSGHGTPGGIPTFDLEPVSGGGGPCIPK